MRFALAHLRKLIMPYSCDESLDLSSELDGFEDIISSKPANVHMIIRERGIDTYLFEFDIKIYPYQPDAVRNFITPKASTLLGFVATELPPPAYSTLKLLEFSSSVEQVEIVI